MRNLALTLICLTFLSGCKDEKSKITSESNTTKTETKKSSAKIEDFDCATFFEKGDYSSICFIDSMLPEYSNRGCIFDFVTKGDKHYQDIKVQFDSKGSSSLAEMSFNLYKSNYKNGKVTDVPNLGDAAFFDVHGTDLKSLSRSNKDLYVHYKNMTFILMVTYQTNTEMPCFYDDKALLSFAETIIENL